MATNDMGPGPLKKARRLVKKITQKVTKGTFLNPPKKYPGEKNNPFAQKGGTTKKYQPGGKTTSFTDDIATGLDNVFRKTYPFNIPHTKVTKALKAVDDRITKGHEGEQPDWYNKFKDKVKKTMHVPLKKNQKGGGTKTTYKTGGMVTKKKKYGAGGPTTKSNTTPMEQSSQPNTPPVGTNKLTGDPRFKTGGIKKSLRKAQAGKSVYSGPMNEYESNVIDNSNMSAAAKAKARQPFLNPKNTRNQAVLEAGDVMTDERAKYYDQGAIWGNQVPKPGPHVSPYHKKGGAAKKMYKTGGMVNANAKITASKVAKGRPVKSTAPKKALPKAKLGMAVKGKYYAGGITDTEEPYVRNLPEVNITATKGKKTRASKAKPKAMYGMTMKGKKSC